MHVRNLFGGGLAHDRHQRGRFSATVGKFFLGFGNFYKGLRRVHIAQGVETQAERGERLAGALGFVVGAVQGLVQFAEGTFDGGKIAVADLGDTLECRKVLDAGAGFFRGVLEVGQAVDSGVDLALEGGQRADAGQADGGEADAFERFDQIDAGASDF